MDNQHKKIKGYRDLSLEEIDLMNRIKTTGAELLALQAEVRDMTVRAAERLCRDADAVREHPCSDVDKPEVQRWDNFQTAEPQRWVAIAKTDIQTGLMALIRAVAQPTL